MKLFPIQRSYYKKMKPYPYQIPWEIAERAYQAYRHLYGDSQSMERLAERGGFAPEEMDKFLPNWREECSVFTRLNRELQDTQRELTELVGERVGHMSDSRLQEIADRASRATPGPWHASESIDPNEGYIYTDDTDVVADTCESFRAQADADFIAAARDDVPWLLAEHERLSRELRQLSDVIMANIPRIANAEAARRVVTVAQEIEAEAGSLDSVNEPLTDIRISTFRRLREALRALAAGGEPKEG